MTQAKGGAPVVHECANGDPARTACGIAVVGDVQTTANSMSEGGWRYCRLCRPPSGSVLEAFQTQPVTTTRHGAYRGERR